MGHKIMLDTYTRKEHETLEVLRIYPMKTLALEEKQTHESFEEYDPDSMVLKLNMWRTELSSLIEEVLQPVHINVKKDMLMSDFLDLLGRHFNISPANLLVQKRNPMLNSAKNMELVSEKPSEALKKLRINEGVNLFIEDATVLYPREQDPTLGEASDELTKWEREFELASNRFSIKFNDPFTQNEAETTALTAGQIHETQSKIYANVIVVDRRISVLDLKIKIVSFFDDFPLNELIFRRGGAHGQELVEDDLTLKQAQFYNMVCLYLEKGMPSQLG